MALRTNESPVTPPPAARAGGALVVEIGVRERRDDHRRLSTLESVDGADARRGVERRRDRAHLRIVRRDDDDVAPAERPPRPALLDELGGEQLLAQRRDRRRLLGRATRVALVRHFDVRDARRAIAAATEQRAARRRGRERDCAAGGARVGGEAPLVHRL